MEALAISGNSPKYLNQKGISVLVTEEILVVNGVAIALSSVSMSKWLKVGFFVVLIASIALISMFPKAPGQGSYQAVHGPTTVFDAWLAALLLTAILLSAGRAAHAPIHASSDMQAGSHDPKERSCTMLC